MNRAVHMLKTAIRRSINLMGRDIVGYNSKNQRWRLKHFLARSGIATIFDVGANRGAFGQELRELGFRGRIVSFEPLQDAYAVLAAAAKSDPLWQAVNIGLGDKSEQRAINVAANSQSSSFLPMLAAHEQAAPESRYIKQQMATIRRLDEVFHEYAKPGDAVFLKIDAQGFEKLILDGAKAVLKDIPIIELECSLVALYDNVAPIETMIGTMRELGYSPIDQRPTFYHHESHHLMQMDMIFLRQ